MVGSKKAVGGNGSHYSTTLGDGSRAANCTGPAMVCPPRRVSAAAGHRKYLGDESSYPGRDSLCYNGEAAEAVAVHPAP